MCPEKDVARWLQVGGAAQLAAKMGLKGLVTQGNSVTEPTGLACTTSTPSPQNSGDAGPLRLRKTAEICLPETLIKWLDEAEIPSDGMWQTTRCSQKHGLGDNNKSRSRPGQGQAHLGPFGPRASLGPGPE